MRYDELIEEVEEKTGIDDRAETERTAVGVVQTLSVQTEQASCAFRPGRGT
jgi:hypothetical protein